MKFVRFFCLLSLAAIIASALAEDLIVQTSFFKKYLDESIEEVNYKMIEASEIPSEVMRSFMQSPFKDLSIQKVHKVEDHTMLEAPTWIWLKNVAPKKSKETLYVLSLTDNIDKNIKAVISFNYQGELRNVKEI